MPWQPSETIGFFLIHFERLVPIDKYVLGTMSMFSMGKDSGYNIDNCLNITINKTNLSYGVHLITNIYNLRSECRFYDCISTYAHHR